MSKRIQDLLPKPWTFPYPDREMYSKEQMVHFAEQIAKEAIDAIDTFGYKSSSDTDAASTELFKNCLKHHFGIKQ